MNWDAILQILQERATSVGLQILGALVLYMIGRWLISLVVNAIRRVLVKQEVEVTVMRFIGNTISVALNVTLVVALLGYFGVQTTAVLIAAAGLAIGTAWAGLLSNFAAGSDAADVHAFWPGARRPAVLSQRSLLAGLLRRQYGD